MSAGGVLRGLEDPLPKKGRQYPSFASLGVNFMSDTPISISMEKSVTVMNAQEEGLFIKILTQTLLKENNLFPLEHGRGSGAWEAKELWCGQVLVRIRCCSLVAWCSWAECRLLQLEGRR